MSVNDLGFHGSDQKMYDIDRHQFLWDFLLAPMVLEDMYRLYTRRNGKGQVTLARRHGEVASRTRLEDEDPT